MMWLKRDVYLKPDDGGEGGGGGGGAAVIEAPAPAPAPTSAPSPTPAAPAAPAAPTPPAPAASSPAAPAPAPAATPAPAASGAPAPSDPAAKKETEAYWPGDWRETMANGDAKLLARLQRYGSPQAVSTALIAAQNRISSGELKPVLGKDATVEEVTAWRKEHGIPDEPKGYAAALAGLKFSDGDPLVDQVLAAAHAAHMTPEQAKAVLSVWPKITQQVQEARVETDRQAALAGEEALRAEWGDDFRRHINLVHGLLDGQVTPAFKDSLLAGYLADGTPIGSSPDALKFLLQLALVNNPTGIVVPNASDPMKGVDGEIEQIEALMRSNRSEYNRDAAKQERLRQLYEARETLKSRKT